MSVVLAESELHCIKKHESLLLISNTNPAEQTGYLLEGKNMNEQDNHHPGPVFS